MRTLGLAIRLTRAWVRLYTRGVGPDRRARRRAEIESDLWEHACWSKEEGSRPAATALNIFVRALAGAPADVAWRLENRTESRSTLAKAGRRGMIALTGALGLWFLAMAVMVPLNDWSEADAAGAYGALCAAAALLVFAGLWGRGHSKGCASRIVAAGAILGAALTWWIVAPIVAALAILVWLVFTRELRASPSA